MANKKISELQSRTPSLSDLMLVGDPSSGYSYKCTITTLATLIETDIADGYVTIGTTQTISGAKTFSNTITATSVANATTDPDKFLVLNGSNVVNYRTGSEVLSDIGGQGALTLTTTGTSGAATLVGNTLNIPQYQTALTNPVTGTGTTNYLAKFTSTSAIGNSIVFDDGTNVGISTTSPSYKLDVNGSARVNNTLHFAGTNVTNSIAANAGMILNSDGATSSDRNFQFQIAGSEKMRLDNSGNLGIGTTSPSYPLHAYSTSNARIGVEGTTNFSAFQNINSSGSLYWGIDDNAGANFTGVAYGRFIYSSGAYPLSFFTNSTERMRIDASGNVGIGTTSPTEKLSIGGVGSRISFDTYGLAGANYIGTVEDYKLSLKATRGTSSEIKLGNENLEFLTNSSERMRIKSGGIINLSNVPSSATGLATGDIYRDGDGYLLIVL